jgi:hypothetical protein
MRYCEIATPNHANELNEYRRDLGCQLFKKYGWVVGKRDCSGILPLDQWAPEDRDRLIDRYQRSNPESTVAFPPGWKVEIQVRARFLILFPPTDLRGTAQAKCRSDHAGLLASQNARPEGASERTNRLKIAAQPFFTDN